MPHRGHANRVVGVPESRAPRLRFGPGLRYVFTVVSTLGICGFVLTQVADLDAPRVVIVLLTVLVGLTVLIQGWETYRLDAEGVERRGLDGRSRWSWGELRTVAGTPLEQSPAAAYTSFIRVVRRSLGPSPHANRMTRYEIAGQDGRVLFRIGPWVAHRDRLAAEIRRRAWAARRRARGR